MIFTRRILIFMIVFILHSSVRCLVFSYFILKEDLLIFQNIYAKRDMVCVFPPHSTISTCSVGALLAYSTIIEVFVWLTISILQEDKALPEIQCLYTLIWITDPIIRPYFAFNSFQCLKNVLKTIWCIASQYCSSVLTRYLNFSTKAKKTQ